MSFNRGLWHMNGLPLGNTPVTPWRIPPAGPISSGPVLPASPITGQQFVHTPGSPAPTRALHLEYGSGQWNAAFSFGAATLYVDGTNGKDVQANGYAAGTSAFKTIQFAVNQLLGAQLYGNATISIAAGTYNEQVTIQGIAFGGNYNLTLLGARAADTLGDTTGKTWANPVGNGSAGYTTITSTGTPWTAHAFKGLFLETTSGTGNGQIFVVLDNTTSVITLVAVAGNANVGGTLGDATTHFHVYGIATEISGANAGAPTTPVRAYCIDVEGQPGVILRQLTMDYATQGCAHAAGSGANMTITQCVVNDGIFAGAFYEQLSNGSIVTSTFTGNGFAEVFVNTNSVIIISLCLISGSVSGSGMSIEANSSVTGTVCCYVSETAGIGLATQNGGAVTLTDFIEFNGCGSHGILNDIGSKILQAAGVAASIRFINNGGWGILSQNGSVGSSVSSCTFTTNATGTYSPTTALAGGNS